MNDITIGQVLLLINNLLSIVYQAQINNANVQAEALEEAFEQADLATQRLKDRLERIRSRND